MFLSILLRRKSAGGLTLCLLLAVLLTSARPWFRVALQDIRTGFHYAYSRVVIQTNFAVPYDVSLEHSRQMLLIHIPAIESIEYYGQVTTDPNDKFIAGVTYLHSGNGLTVSVRLKHANVQVERKTLQRPARVVLDISQSTLPPTPAQSNPVEEMLQSETGIYQPWSVFDPNDAEQPAFVYADTLPSQKPFAFLDLAPSAENALPVTQDSSAAAEPTTARNRTEPAHTHKSNLVWYFAGALFLALNLMLLLWRRKRRHAATSKTPNNKRRKMPNPSSPRAEMPSREFLEFLKTAVQTSQQEPSESGRRTDESQEPEEVVKLRQVMGALQAVGKNDSEPATALPPEFKKIAADLNLIAEDDQRTDEEIKQQLIGKDGVEFMKNIKRLYLSQQQTQEISAD